MKYLITLLFCLVIVALPASAGGTKNRPTNTQSTTTAASYFYSADQIEFGAFGLTPGDAYEGTVEFYPDNPNLRHVQDSGYVSYVQDDGGIQFTFGTKFITRGLPGTIETKVTLPNQGYDAEPINTQYGPAETSYHIP